MVRLDAFSRWRAPVAKQARPRRAASFGQVPAAMDSGARARLRLSSEEVATAEECSGRRSRLPAQHLAGSGKRDRARRPPARGSATRLSQVPFQDLLDFDEKLVGDRLRRQRRWRPAKSSLPHDGLDVPSASYRAGFSGRRVSWLRIAPFLGGRERRETLGCDPPNSSSEPHSRGDRMERGLKLFSVALLGAPSPAPDRVFLSSSSR